MKKSSTFRRACIARSHAMIAFRATQISEGFTLVELLVTIAIAGILAIIAIPSFTGSIARSRVSGISSDFVVALNLARSEAIRRGKAVTLRSKGTSGSFTEGWDVFSDANGDGAKAGTVTADDGTVLRDHEALNTSLSLVAINSDGTPNTGITAIFNSRGAVNGDAAQFFKLCHSDLAIKGRKVTISKVGRIKAEEFTCS